MRKTWLIGAAQFYEVLKMADPNLTGPRRLISKCLILLRHFSQQDFILTPPLNQIAIDTTTGKSIGKHENVGIMKIGHILHDETDPGTLLVRRFGDATMSREANPTLILDMLKRGKGNEMCPTCSNREVGFLLNGLIRSQIVVM